MQKITEKEAKERLQKIKELQQGIIGYTPESNVERKKTIEMLGEFIRDLGMVRRKKWAKIDMAYAIGRIGVAMYGMGGNLAGAISQLRISEALFRETGELSGLVQTQWCMALLLRDRESEEEIRSLVEEIIKEAEELIEKGLKSDNLPRESKLHLLVERNNIADLLMDTGRSDRAIGLLEANVEFCRTAREGKDTAYIEYYLHNLGIYELYKGDIEKAEKFLTQALEILKEQANCEGITLSFASLDYLAAVKLQQAGDVDGAIKNYLYHHDFWETSGKRMYGLLNMRLAECYLAKKEFDSAQLHCGTAYSIFYDLRDGKKSEEATSLAVKIAEEITGQKIVAI